MHEITVIMFLKLQMTGQWIILKYECVANTIINFFPCHLCPPFITILVLEK